MPEHVLHPQTAAALKQLQKRQSHAVLITGPAGSGKYSLSLQLAANSLNISVDKLISHPHVITVTPEEGKAISIDSIRDMQRKLILSIPGVHEIARVVLIENAHLMTTEAQNSLLKTLEEPPLNTVVILTALSQDSLLATIQSRVQLMQAIPPEPGVLKAAMKADGYDDKDIDMAMVLGGNLPGLVHAMLSSDESHPLYAATIEARRLLQSKTYDRLVAVDALSKQRQLCSDIAFILGQMARTALARGAAGNTAATERWKRILTVSYESERQLRSNTQAKLVMINFMLAL